VAIVFNGAVYNYAELRQELQGLGHSFHSTGDTEVLLHAYLQWGQDCLSRLNGMWAFVIHDTRRGIVFGARDRFGVKPLYYSEDKGTHFFASEIKALHRAAPGTFEVDPARLGAFIASGHLETVPGDATTFFRRVRQIEAGHCFELAGNGALRVRRYWQLPAEDHSSGNGDPVSAFADLFESAVALRLRSDVPAGVALSGGMDSTSIICAMARLRKAGGCDSIATLHAFSYMPPEFDESRYIQRTVEATGATLHPITITPTGLWSGLDRLLDSHDEPVHSATAFVSYEIYRAAAREGVKVLLCGQGADETLGGYPSFFKNWWHTLLRDGQFKAVLGEIQTYARAHNASVISESLATGLRWALLYPGRSRLYRFAMAGRRMTTAYPFQGVLTDEMRAALEAPEPVGCQTLASALAYETEVSPLPLYLRVEDRNSMAHSVEARLPFLDYRLVSMAFRLAGHWKLRGEWNKYVLRQAAVGLIPEEVRTRIDKMGFPTPMNTWLRDELHPQITDVLESRAFLERGTFEPLVVRKMLRQHRTGERNYGSALFNLVQTELWLRVLESRSRATTGAKLGSAGVTK
jgi:asparagine synthase (glutamine-hydrolysing)